MALPREEVNRLLAAAAEARRGQVHQLWVDTRLSDEQLDALSTVDALDRRDRAREMVALEGRPWHVEMDAQLDHVSKIDAPQGRPTATKTARTTAEHERELRAMAVPLDDLDLPPTER